MTFTNLQKLELLLIDAINSICQATSVLLKLVASLRDFKIFSLNQKCLKRSIQINAYVFLNASFNTIQKKHNIISKSHCTTVNTKRLNPWSSCFIAYVSFEQKKIINANSTSKVSKKKTLCITLDYVFKLIIILNLKN